MKKIDYKTADHQKLNEDLRLNHRQRVLMYSDLDSISRWPSSDELKRLYAILYHRRDVDGLARFDARYDIRQLFPDDLPSFPTVTEKESKQYFNDIWKMIRKVNPSVRKTKSRIDPMSCYPYPGRQFYQSKMPGAPSLTNYFYTADDDTVYFLKRSYLEDQPKKWLLSFARKNGIFVTTPSMIKGTEDDISLNGLILQILASPGHDEPLIHEMMKRRPKLSDEDADAILSGEYITIDK
jgi:hypothetical protein